MNKLNSVDFFSRYHLSGMNDFPIDNVEINLQDADSSTLCFYNLKNIEYLDLFLDRLNKSKTQCVVIPRIEELFLDDLRIVQVPHHLFMKLQVDVCNILYSCNKVRLVGVTGTNGKTSVCYLAAQLATLNGLPAASIGTLGLCDGNGDIIKYHQTTTPSYIDFRKELVWLSEKKIYTVFIELSSHALEQNRLQGYPIKCAAWTNITQDHLDYHETFENYLQAKLRIKDHIEPEGKLILSRNKDLQEYVSVENSVIADNLDLYDIVVDSPFFKLPHNVENLELVVEILKNIRIKILPFKTSDLRTPPGRLESVPFADRHVFVDFAHTPDALENVCSALKEVYAQSELTVVFGCGGDRDRSKRSLMGEAVERWADSIVVTSDNPRNEDPEQIIDDAVSTMHKSFYRNSDRTNAIYYALEHSKSGDVILIAGKGHEDYQEIKGTRYPYNDYEVVLSFKGWSK